MSRLKCVACGVPVAAGNFCDRHLPLGEHPPGFSFDPKYVDGCAGLAGWLFGHRMVPRYDKIGNEVHATPGLWMEFSGPQSRTVYVGEVCTRCGFMVERPSTDRGEP